MCLKIVIDVALSVLPPKHVDELLPWYHCWSNVLAIEMHQRHLVRNKACQPICLPSLSPCTCTSEWWCKPHDACFIHDSCFCPSSGSFPPVKPPRTSLLS